MVDIELYEKFKSLKASWIQKLFLKQKNYVNPIAKFLFG